MKILTVSFIAGFLLLSSSSYAAIPPQKKMEQLHKQALQALKIRRTKLRNLALKEIPDQQRLELLNEIAFNKGQSISMRWRALTSMGMIEGKKAQPHIEKAVRSEQWYMKNAGIVAMAHANKNSAVEWAKRLLTDRALLVRTAAVQTLKKLKATSSESDLWKSLYAKQNYKRGQSLWVRRHIVETLAEIAQPGRESNFIQVLKDPDRSLVKPAIQGLERITNKKLGESGANLMEKQRLWLQWWQKKQRQPKSGR